MKKVMIAVLIVGGGLAGVCLAGTNNGVSAGTNPSVTPSGPNSSYTNSASTNSEYPRNTNMNRDSSNY